MIHMSFNEIFNFIRNIETEERSVNFSRSSIALTSGSILFIFFSCYYLEKVALENGYKYSEKLSQSWLYDKNYVYIK